MRRPTRVLIAVGLALSASSRLLRKRPAPRDPSDSYESDFSDLAARIETTSSAVRRRRRLQRIFSLTVLAVAAAAVLTGFLLAHHA